METVAQAVALVGVRAWRPVGRGTACVRPAGGIDAVTLAAVARTTRSSARSPTATQPSSRESHRPPHRADADPGRPDPADWQHRVLPFLLLLPVRDSRCVSYHIYYDNMALMAQLVLQRHFVI